LKKNSLKKKFASLRLLRISSYCLFLFVDYTLALFRIKVLIRDRIGFYLDNVAYILSHTSSYLGRYTED